MRILQGCLRLMFGFLFLASVPARAGNLDSPGAPTDPASAMHRLEDVYNRLDAGVPCTPSVFAEPAAGPGSTGHTLDEIMAKAPATNASAAVPGDVVVGKAFWELGSGAWGSNVGTRAYAPVPKTGQTTEYRTGDDGTYQEGAAASAPRFTDHGDGTVTDHLTGLMWTKDANISGTVTWDTAVDNCQGYSLAGYSDWRLPNPRELQSLADYAHFNPALPLAHPFSGLISAGYWSSTTYANDSAYAWHVSLDYGQVVPDIKSNGLYVWPVRGP